MEETLKAAPTEPLGRVPAIPAAITLLVLFLAAFAGLFGYFLAQGANETAARLNERSSAAAQVVATNALWISELANQTLRRIDAVMGPTLSGNPADLRPALEGLPSLTQIHIIDRNANRIYSTVPGAEGVSVADREYFIALRDGAPFYMSGQLTSRVNGDSVFVFTKRVERNREFAGAIVVAFPVALLQDFWATLDFEEASTISLVRADGMLMARFPPVDGPLDLSNHPLFTEHLPKGEVGTYLSPASPVDGIARVVSYRRVPGTEIIALASISSERAWASFNGAVIAVFVIVSPIVLGLAIGSFWIVRLLYRDAVRKGELEALLETNVMLFREIHHRVKNNLQSVQALIRMQDIPPNAKLDLQSRLTAMAAMHEHIYRFDQYKTIKADEFIPAIVDTVIAAYGRSVDVSYEIDPVLIDIDQATPLSLLLSELVTNCMKYAFPEGNTGTLKITLKQQDDGRCDLTVADNGIGIGDVSAARSMGMRLIKGAVGQMAGTFRFSADNGTRFSANIDLRASKDRA